MNTRQAQEKLRRYLLFGLRVEWFWAKEAREFATVIGNHSQKINQSTLSYLFSGLQLVFSDRETVCVAKMFDKPNPRYPVRSIKSILNLIEDNSEVWSLPQRDSLVQLLSANEYYSVENKTNGETSRDVVNYYRGTMPSVEKKG
jgi:hypothetical protein